MNQNTELENYTTQEINDAFSSQQLPKKKLSASYKFAIFISSIVMILLPLIYLSMIGGLAYYIYHYWNVVYPSLSYWEQDPMFPVIFSIIGGILCIFMIKPIFAKMPKAPKNLIIIPGQEPVLEALIAKICDRLNAPYPSEISLSRDVNASASLRNGIWSLFSNDLRLTIGLPLIHGLKTQQLSEVLAHEFGHFSQGLGMKSTYITRSINFWFLRVVYQRDRLDVGLEKAAEKMPDVRLAVFFWAIQILIWCTRAILKVLMWIGQAVSCHMLRQMEYDADHHAARIVGSELFARTSRRMNALMIGQHIGDQSAQVMWMEKLLPNKMARLTCAKTLEIEDQDLDKFIEDQAKEAKAHLFDTHPTDAERTKAVEKLNLPGVFHLDGAAERLILKAGEYDKLVTRMFYEEECEFDLKTCKLLDDQQMDVRLNNARVRVKSMEKWYHDAIGMLCPIPVRAWAFPKFKTEEHSLRQIESLTEQIEPKLETLKTELESLNKLNIDHLRGCIINDCLTAGLQLNDGAFDMPKPTSSAAIMLRDQSKVKMNGALLKVNEVQLLLVEKLMATLVLRCEENPEKASEINELIAFIFHLTPFITNVQNLNTKVTPLIQILNAVEGQELPEDSYNWIQRRAASIKTDLSTLWGQAGHIIYPLNEDKKSMQQLAFNSANEGKNEDSPFAAIGDADDLIDKTHQFYVDALAQFAVLAEEEE